MTRAPLFIVGLTLVAACGSSEPGVISIGAGWSQNAASADAATGERSSLAVSPSIEFVLADGVSAPAERAHAWRVTAPRDATSRLEGLAEAFAIDGDPVTGDDGTVTIGDDRRVSSWTWGGIVSWSYESAVMSGGDSTVSEPCDPSAGLCDTAPPDRVALPENLISTGDALVKARRILGAAGYGADQTTLVGGSSEWSTWVDIELTAGGVGSGLFGRIDFGADGVVTSAYGQFVALERADEYPLVDLATAVGRLGVPIFASGPRSDDASAAVDSSAGSATDSVADSPVTVTVTGVDMVLQPETQSDTSTLLVPAYSFTSADGLVGVVLALEDKHMNTGNGGVEPTPGTALPEPAPAPDEMPPIPQSDADTVIGLTEDEATKIAADRGWTVRIAERDGEQYMLTLDFQVNRVNLSITGGRVTAVSVG
ncbi:MAG: hypothetical protein RLY50_490 [Actinomycetota bacterium]